MPAIACQSARLPALTPIDVSGADAESFLAAQLSQRPPQRAERRAALAAWHDARGRVQALFRVLPRDDGYRLLTHASVADDVAAALARYVLRARVRIEIPTDAGRCTALLGECGEWLEGAGITLGAATGAVTERDGVLWLRLAPALVHAVAPAERSAGSALPPAAAGADDAETAEIRLGLPSVSAPLRGLFLPQMLNLDRLDAIAFDKGCYPGQEIIARAQNLGTVKRRMRRFTVSPGGALPSPGSRILDDADAEVGTVVRAAHADAGVELLAVVRLDALDRPLFHERSPEARLTAAALPYESE